MADRGNAAATNDGDNPNNNVCNSLVIILFCVQTKKLVQNIPIE